MQAEDRREKVASVPVKPGIFALRYVGSQSERPPRVFVEVSPSSRDDVQVVFVPGRSKGVLDEPKTYALVVAERDGHLQLTVAPWIGGGANARVQLEPLNVEDAKSAETSESAPEAGPSLSARGGAFRGVRDTRSVEPAAFDREARSSGFGAKTAAVRDSEISSFSITCHVSRLGNVSAAAGEWIGGPDAPAVIEGLALHWPRQDASGLEYQVLVQGSRGQWSSWVRAGQFAGTQGRRLALVGLRLRLTAQAPDYARLSGEAAFLGCPLVREAGRELEFTSHASVDPLVGLRLQMEGEAPSTTRFADATEEEKPDSVSKGPVLRVFQSKMSVRRVGDLGA